MKEGGHTKGHIEHEYDSTYRTFWKKQKSGWQFLATLGMRICLTRKGYEGTLWGDGYILNLISGGDYRTIQICQNSIKPYN